MALQQITSPGVQIREIDQSSVPVGAGGTSVLVPGFAAQGPVDEVFALGSVAEFERVYGKPTNSAERYFHQTARAAFNSNANVLTTRLPYGSGAGFGVAGKDLYTALFYPVVPYGPHACRTPGDFGTATETINPDITGSTGVSLASTDAKVYVFGKPQLLVLDRVHYEDLINGNFTWNDKVPFNKDCVNNDKDTWSNAGMIVANKLKTNINDKYEGYYFAATDNTELNPATNFTSIRGTYTVNANSSDLSLEIPSTRLNFPLSGTPTSNDDSVSELLEEVPGFDISGDDFDDTAILGLVLST